MAEKTHNLTGPDIIKLVHYLMTDNRTMQKDINDYGDKMPFMKALFQQQFTENERLIQKLFEIKTEVV
jgi:hypothetical protein